MYDQNFPILANWTMLNWQAITGTLYLMDCYTQFMSTCQCVNIMRCQQRTNPMVPAQVHNSHTIPVNSQSIIPLSGSSCHYCCTCIMDNLFLCQVWGRPLQVLC